MLQNLYLVRHAHALDDAPCDELRPLSPKGHKQISRLVRGLSRQSLHIEFIWHSGLLRALETAQGLAAGLACDASLEQVDGLAPFDDPTDIAATLHESSGHTLIAGHEPNLSHLASLLIAGHSEFQRITFQKASILALSRLKAGKQATPWVIEWHLHHRFFKK